MVTSPASDTDEVEDFSDAEIAASLKPFFAEVDADYDAAFDDIKKVFEAKGPPTEEKAARHPWLVKSHDAASEARDESGQWTGGAKPLHHRLAAHFATLKGKTSEHDEATPFMDELSKLDQPSLLKTLTAAGIEGLKPRHSKKALLNQARLRLTAAVRARERAEV